MKRMNVEAHTVQPFQYFVTPLGAISFEYYLYCLEYDKMFYFIPKLLMSHRFSSLCQ